MKNLKIYRCKSCRNLITSSNTIDIACCGEKLINLEAIDLEKLPQLEKEKYSPKISEVDQEFFIEFKHPMVKDDFISAVLVVSYDKIAVINMFAEQEASFSLQRIAGVKIFAITSKNLLIKVL